MKYFKAFLTLSILLYAGTSFAVTGDILYSNCAGGGCSGSGSGTGWVRTIETNGCYSGECLKLDAKYNSGSGLYGSGSTSITANNVAGHKEITVVYYIKFDKWGKSISGLNTKAFRPHVGTSKAGSYYFATIAGTNTSGNEDFQMNNQWGTLRPTSIFTPRDASQTWPGDTRFTVANGDGTWDVPNGEIRGKFFINGQDGFGTQWTKVRHWIKLPSGDNTGDGESKLWINDQLAFHFYKGNKLSGTSNNITSFTWYPASEAKEPFQHWMDEMIVYEGYVPPGTQTEKSENIQAPQNLRITSISQ